MGSSKAIKSATAAFGFEGKARFGLARALIPVGFPAKSWTIHTVSRRKVGAVKAKQATTPTAIPQSALNRTSSTPAVAPITRPMPAPSPAP
jgi:hypothetical protein